MKRIVLLVGVLVWACQAVAGMRYERYHNTYHESAVYKIMLKRKNMPNPQTTIDQAMKIIRAIHDVSGGMHQVVYLVGWQYDGHDSKYPSWDKVGAHCASTFSIDPKESLRRFMREARKLNADVSLHINVNDAYPSSPHWQAYKSANLLRLDKNGEPVVGGVWDGEPCHQVSHLKEWRSGRLQERILGLLKMVPELRESKTIHIDALFGVDSPFDGISLEEDVKAIDEMVDFWHEQGIDVTTENITTLDQIGYFPMVYHLNLDERLRILYPPEVLCGGDSEWNARNLNYYMYDDAWHARTPAAGCIYEEAWGDGHWGDLEGDALDDPKEFLGRFFSRTLLNAYYNRSHVIRHQIDSENYVVERENGVRALVRMTNRALEVTDNGRRVVQDGDYILDFPWGGGTLLVYSQNGCDKEFSLPNTFRHVALFRGLLHPSRTPVSIAVVNGIVRVRLRKGEAMTLLPSKEI